MGAVSLAQLVIDAKTYANMTTGGPLTQTEWDGLVNRALEAFWVDALAINNTLRVSSSVFTITNTAIPSATLPVDFMQEYKVVKDYNTSSEQPIRRNNETSSTQERTYRIEGGSIIIDPWWNSAGTYTLRYNPLPAALAEAAPGPQVDLDTELAQFRDYFSLKAAMKALQIEESSVSDISADFKEVKLRVIAWAARQRSSEPDQVVDVRPRRSRRSGNWLP